MKSCNSEESINCSKVEASLHLADLERVHTCTLFPENRIAFRVCNMIHVHAPPRSVRLIRGNRTSVWTSFEQRARRRARARRQSPRPTRFSSNPAGRSIRTHNWSRGATRKISTVSMGGRANEPSTEIATAGRCCHVRMIRFLRWGDRQALHTLS